jgi:hypothetical protein
VDVNEYMKKSIALQEAILKELQKMNAEGISVVVENSADPENAIPVMLLGSVELPSSIERVAGVESVPGTAAQVEGKKDEPKPAADAKQEEKPAETKAPDKKKGPSVDDARAALKKFAAIEGNDAAMELLTGLGAASVSALAEKGDGELQKLIDKCEGKAS